jgi:hypothetical protein
VIAIIAASIAPLMGNLARPASSQLGLAFNVNVFADDRHR